MAVDFVFKMSYYFNLWSYSLLTSPTVDWLSVSRFFFPFIAACQCIFLSQHHRMGGEAEDRCAREGKGERERQGVEERVEKNSRFNILIY